MNKVGSQQLPTAADSNNKMVCLIPLRLRNAIKKFLTNITGKGSSFPYCGSMTVLLSHMISSPTGKLHQMRKYVCYFYHKGKIGKDNQLGHLLYGVMEIAENLKLRDLNTDSGFYIHWALNVQPLDPSEP